MIKKLILCIILIMPLTVKADDCTASYIELKQIVTNMGWRVTSEMGGGHNAHSRHYQGKAIDISVRQKTQFHIDVLYTIITERGFIFRDERVRPKGQKVWGGPHIHLAVPLCR